jgi:hypothetical protein
MKISSDTSKGTSTDRIEKQILLKAPRSRVWRAVSNADEFGKWFCVDFNGKQFVAGQPIQGKITYRGYESSASSRNIICRFAGIRPRWM